MHLLVLRKKSHRIFSAWKIKKNADVPVYIENTQKKQKIGNTYFIHIL